MSCENEDKITKAPGTCSDGSSCRQMFAPSVRVKEPGSRVNHLHWLHIQLLVVLLAGQTSGNQIPAASSYVTTNAQTSVYYTIEVNVDVKGKRKDKSEIIAWLSQVFQNKLESCTFPTTATSSSPQTTSASTLNETTLVTTATTVQNYNTTTAAATSPSEHSNTTIVATSTVLKKYTSTAPTTASKYITTTTTATSTALKSISTTTARTTASKDVGTTTATITTASKDVGTTTATITTASKDVGTITATITTASKDVGTTTATITTASKHVGTITARTTTASKHVGTTTATITTASKHIGTTTARTTTALKHVGTTTARTTTALKHISTATTTKNQVTIAAPTTSSPGGTEDSIANPDGGGQNKPMRNPNSNQSNKPRVARQIGSSGISNAKTTGLFQEIEVTCTVETAIKNTNCLVTLSLSRRVSPCCILRTLCAASKTSSDILVVGKRADIASPLQNECNGEPKVESYCTYSGQTGASCEEMGPAYVVHQSNSSHCDADKNNCSCSAYCSGTDAYYTFQISIQDPEMGDSYVSSLLSKLKQPTNCAASADVSCPVSIVASEYKDADVACGINCTVVLRFAREVPTCTVSAAVINVFQPVKQIRYNGFVARAAICGNSEVGDNPQEAQFTQVNLNLKPADFCAAIEESSILSCHNGTKLVVQLEESCVHFTTTAQPNNTTITTPGQNVTTAQPNNTTITTPGQNVTTAQPNNTTITTPGRNVTTAQPNNTTMTTPGPNVTTAQLNNTTITTLSPNVTIALPNTTTASENVASSPLKTTANVLKTTTTAANVTVAASHSTTATTTNESVSVNPSGSPTTNQSVESQANYLLDLTRDMSKLNSSQVDQLVSQLERLLSGPTVSLSLGNISIHIVSNLLGASPEKLSDSSNRIIGIVDTVALKLVLEESPETLLSPAVAMSVKPADGSNFQETFFSISDPNHVQVRGDPRLKIAVRTDPSVPQGSIRLPPSLTQDLTSEEQQLVSRVQFNFYQKSTVFQDKALGERKLNSGILGARVANLSISGLQDDVVIHLRNIEPVPGNFVAKCVFWDFTLNDGSGGWNPTGCNVQNSTDNETVCGCNHLTSFAILLDLSRQPLTSRLQATILTFITYIGCGVSAIFLSITLLTYLAFGKLRKDIPSKILIQLCLALLLLNMVFLVDAWLALYPDAVGLCISTAWFLHYFLLVAFTWMGLESVHMYLALVKVFNSYVSHYMLRFSLVGWGVPMIVVIIVIAVDKDNYGLISYGKFPDGTSDDFCWLKNDIAFYVAVVAYFCVIFLLNVIMFIVVLVQLCRIKRQNPHNVHHRTTLQDVRSVVGITILLGLTWGFAFFAWGPVNLPFMYLFAIFNSLQGFFIFVFHCAVKENVRKQWRTYLCCGRMRLAENSEWSRTATQKTVKKSSVTRLTSHHSSKSSQSNNSSSSSSFLVSDASEQINGIGSPFEDRTITADEHPSMDVVLNEINRQYRNQQAP